MPEQTTKQSFIREYWYVFFLIGVFLIFAAAQILRLLTPKQAPNQENTWQGLTPGYSNFQDVEKSLGEPIGTGQKNGKTYLEYQSSYEAYPNEVYFSDNQKLEFIKEYIDYQSQENIQNYIDTLGKADLELTDLGTSDAVLAYIYLEKGLVIVAHKQSGQVEQKWYFQPTTQENFLKQWGQKLSESPYFQDKLDLGY